jgi:hypothetical protein
MKKLLILSVASCVLLFSTSCHHGNTMIINNGDGDMSIYYTGEIKFNDAENGIESMTPDSYMHYTKNNRKLEADCNYHGEIKYQLSDDGRVLNVNDEEGKKFMAFAIRDMINAGFDAKGRMERLYRKGGNAAILGEVDNLQSDFVKAQYLDFLITSDSISPHDIRLAIKKSGASVGSDFEKGNLLNKVPARYLKDSLISMTWFEAVRTIGSDFEKSNALKYIAREHLTIDQFDNLVDVSQTMGSDFEKSNVLKVLIDKSSFADTNLIKTLDAVNQIGSDFEKVNLIRMITEKTKPGAANFDRLIDATEHIGSDFDKGNLVKDLIRPGIPAGADFDKLMSVIDHIGGDFDKINLLKDVAGKNIQNEQQWISIINSAGEISSDFDKSNLLLAIAPQLPKSENIKSAYAKVAKTINSEEDYGRVMKAFD